jgi:molybdate transport system substrate-binding protein
MKIYTILMLLLFPWQAFAVQQLPTLTIMADNSLSVAVAKIARNYSQKKQVVVNTSFTPQKAQQLQISEGAAADILITTKTIWIENLKQQGLVDIYSQTTFAKNRIVLVGAADSSVVMGDKNNFPSAQIITNSGGNPMFLIGHPETSIDGSYAKEALRDLNAENDLEPYTLYIKQPEQFFDMVVNQQAYGVCFYSAAMRRAGVKIIGALPESSHTPIVYYAVVIAGNNMNEARKFLEYIKSKEVRKILKDSGLEDVI